MSGRSLPALLRTNVLQRPETQSVDTSILRPVNFNQQGCKFVFEKKGILDSNSHLQMKLRVVSANGAAVGANDFAAYLPTSTGALAWIRRAYLTIGGRRVSNLDEVGQYNTYMRLHYSNEYKKGVIMPKQGGNDIFLGSTAQGLSALGQATTIAARGFASPFGVLGREASEYAIVEANVGGAAPPLSGQQNTPEMKISTRPEQQIKGSFDNCPTFMVGLSQLIPFLRGMQLPLFAINQEVALNIEWSDDFVGSRVQNNTGAAQPLITEFSEPDCLICADYLFYPDLMEGLADEIMNKGGYDVPFDEILVQENSVKLESGNPAVGAPFNKKFEFQLAYGGKKVKSIVIQRQEVDDAKLELNNVGVYNSMAYRLGKEMQLNIDSKNWYSMPLKNSSLQKSEADNVEDGLPLMLCDYRWSWKSSTKDDGTNDVLGISDRELNGYAQTAEVGSMHWDGIKLSNAFGQGKRVSNLPMIYSDDLVVNTTDENQQRRYRFFVKTQRVANISSGIVNVIE